MSALRWELLNEAAVTQLITSYFRHTKLAPEEIGVLARSVNSQVEVLVHTLLHQAAELRGHQKIA